ncbi:hypothetical protein TNCV_1351071 [Trichonephila clavipes]|nr:hypothetical protein TNCV_1351071 [Trichonephila clavipes]
MGKIITTTRWPFPFEQIPLGLREAFKDPKWFCAGCTGTREQLDLDLVPAPQVSSLDSTIDKGFRICSELTQVISKKEQNTSILRSLALETIDTMYPDPGWVHIYNDGSLLKDHDSAGAGVVCHLFSFYLTTAKFTTTFDGEVAFLQVALVQLHCHLNSFTRDVVFCDSKAANFAVNSNSPSASSNILDCKKLLQSLSEYSKHIFLKGIPGHCGVTGNELVDHLQGRELPFNR